MSSLPFTWTNISRFVPNLRIKNSNLCRTHTRMLAFQVNARRYTSMLTHYQTLILLHVRKHQLNSHSSDAESKHRARRYWEHNLLFEYWKFSRLRRNFGRVKTSYTFARFIIFPPFLSYSTRVHHELRQVERGKGYDPIYRIARDVSYCLVFNNITRVNCRNIVVRSRMKEIFRAEIR